MNSCSDLEKCRRLRFYTFNKVNPSLTHLLLLLTVNAFHVKITKENVLKYHVFLFVHILNCSPRSSLSFYVFIRRQKIFLEINTDQSAKTIQCLKNLPKNRIHYLVFCVRLEYCSIAKFLKMFVLTMIQIH